MKIVCAWCKKPIGKKEPLHNTAISHGICEKCKQKMQRELKEVKGEKQ